MGCGRVGARLAGILDSEGHKVSWISIPIASGDSTALHITATQIAKHIFNVPRGICRIYDPIREEMYRELGLETISPSKVGAQLLREVIGG